MCNFVLGSSFGAKVTAARVANLYMPSTFDTEDKANRFAIAYRSVATLSIRVVSVGTAEVILARNARPSQVVVISPWYLNLSNVLRMSFSKYFLVELDLFTMAINSSKLKDNDEGCPVL